MTNSSNTKDTQDASEEPKPQEQVGGKQYDTRTAKKYPNGLGGTYYGSPAITRILATFESRVMQLHGSRDYYKPGSKAFAKHWDNARLRAAQDILDLVNQARGTDLADTDGSVEAARFKSATKTNPQEIGGKDNV